jgi:predicted nucleotidyltransferase
MNQEGSWGPRSTEAMHKIFVHPTAGPSYEVHRKLDLTIFDITKYVRLAADANPNVLELIFLDQRDVLQSTDEWDLLRANRDLFLSKKVKYTYTGYAHSQLQRIESHRKWLLNPPKQEPTRADFGLPESSLIPSNVRDQIEETVQLMIRQWLSEDNLELSGAAQDVLRMRIQDFYAASMGVDVKDLQESMYLVAATTLGITDDVLHVVKQEKRYRSARQNWQKYQTWKRERNEARSELEAKHGFDTKHASHLIRLMRTGLEILQGKGLQVKRPDAEELMSIRDGAWSYEHLMEQAKMLEDQISEAYKTSVLPNSPDREKIDQVLMNAIEMAYKHG